jgi:hypothetical protein
MTGIRRAIVLAIGLAVASASLAVAAQPRPYRLNDQQLRELATRITTHRDTFHHSLTRAIDRSPINGSPAEDQIDRAVESFKQATNVLRDRVNNRQSNSADAENVLRRASVIDDLVMRNRLDTPAQTDWQTLRQDMDDLARAYGITWNWSAASENAPSRVNDKQVEQLLKQIGERAGRFDKSLDQAFDRGRLHDPRSKDEIRQSVADFRQAADRLRDRVKGRQSTTLDVEEVLRRGVSIDGFMERHQLSTQAEQNWLALRRDLDTLARAYNVAWNWSNPGYASAAPGAGFRNRLTGTYQLENDRGDDPRQVAERAARAAPSNEREATYQRLLTRLEAPEQLAIERVGNTVTMASTEGRRVTFEADGRDHAEQWSPDRTMSTRATLVGERLVVATTGHRGSDYTVTFDPADDGRGLQMTRVVDDAGLRQPVTVRSSYTRLSDEARWSVDLRGARDPYDPDRPSADNSVVPDGTRLLAVLDNALSAASTREGDFYTLTVRTPAQYQDAVLEGFVSTVNESAQRAGGAAMTLTLRSIRLRDGGSYPFDGVIQDIRTPDGRAVTVDREGTIDEAGDDRTRTAVERGAIGAALGAVIGAIAGGGKGAAIGAVIGAGGGAGTVFIEGRDRLELPRGTAFTIISGGAWNRRPTPTAQR